VKAPARWLVSWKIPGDWEIVDEQIVADPVLPFHGWQASACTGGELTGWEQVRRIGTPGPAPRFDHVTAR
jgi:hypothetical protein